MLKIQILIKLISKIKASLLINILVFIYCFPFVYTRGGQPVDRDRPADRETIYSRSWQVL